MLNDIQNEFFKMLVKTMPFNKINHYKHHSKIPIEDRLNVHIGTIFDTLTSTLRDTFPGVWSLLGADCANNIALAYSYDKNNLPTHGSIELFGNNFPKFLSQFPSTRSILYLEDFATLEWLRYLSYRHRFGNFVLSTKLPEIDLTKIDTLKIEFNKSVFFINSNFPLDQIEEAALSANNERVNLSITPSYGIIFGNDNKTYTLWIDEAHYQILESINEKNTLGEAISSIDHETANIQQLMTDIFALMLQNNLIAKFYQERL